MCKRGYYFFVKNVMKTAIVLDKSYLDGASTEAIQALCDNYTVLVSDELFFELITTRKKSQQRCFSKLPDRPNPVLLIPDVRTLLHIELEHQAECTSLVRQKMQDSFIFNKKLRDASYVPEGEILLAIKEWKGHVAEETNRFIEQCRVVCHFFPELNGIEWKNFPEAIQAARHKTARDEDFIRYIYASLLDNDAPVNAPKPEVISPAWAYFRWVQCQVLCGLRLFGRYQGRLPDDMNEGFMERFEHSMLDSYHLIHGSLVGAIATGDKEIQEDFQLLLPEGILLKPPSLNP